MAFKSERNTDVDLIHWVNAQRNNSVIKIKQCKQTENVDEIMTLLEGEQIKFLLSRNG